MPVAVSKKLFTVHDYHRMGETGILREDDRVELIDGEIIAMSPFGPRHNAAVNRAMRALVMGVGDTAIVQSQGSVRLDLYREPQPDLVLLSPRADFYASRHAGPDDIMLIVEIADSSIEYDREVKARVYAGSGVREYWIADLGTGVVECCSEPRDGAYQSVRRYQRGELVAPESLPECRIAVEVLLGE